ncbi:MAG: sugar phosphate isomerase/epimerase family protein [Oligosphaeraceae bacterium]
MTPKPLGVQLYSVRQDAAKDFDAVLKRIAEIGFMLVEPAGLFDIRPREFRKRIQDLGMDMISSHSPWCAGIHNVGECMDIADELGVKRIVCGYGTADFKDEDAIKATAENTTRIYEVLSRNGYELFQHNHWFEFARMADGRLAYEHYRDLIPAGVKFQLDCFWSTNYGKENAVEMLNKFADRTVLLHIKDGICQQQQSTSDTGYKNGLLDQPIELLPLGTGTLPIPELVKAAPDHVEGVIVELDYCSVEMWKALEQSYEYMTTNGLALGTRR